MSYTIQVRPRKFWFHYNKPASLKAGAPRLTVHFGGVCHIVAHIECRVPVSSKVRARQPRCVIEGKAREVAIDRSTMKAIIT